MLLTAFFYPLRHADGDFGRFEYLAVRAADGNENVAAEIARFLRMACIGFPIQAIRLISLAVTLLRLCIIILNY